MTYSETNPACTTKAIAIGERKLIDEHATPHLISTLQWNTMNCNRSVGEFLRSNLVQENGRCDWSWSAHENAAERVSFDGLLAAYEVGDMRLGALHFFSYTRLQSMNHNSLYLVAKEH